MTIFALDSAGKTASVALWSNGVLLYESYLAAAGTHSETLLALCDAAFQAGGVRPADIQLFALNAGPGSFTGLRIGMGIVKGLAFTGNTLCAPVSTLAALAHSYPADGLLVSALDARRGEVYCALFRRENGIVTRLTADSALSAAQCSALAATHRRAVGTGDLGTNVTFQGTDKNAAHAVSEPIVCLGDGAGLLADDGFVLCSAPYRLGRASGICLAAEDLLKNNACVPAAALSPEYLRLSQAERERAARLQTAQPSTQKESLFL